MASYTWLLRVASPAAVGTYAFVNPVIALLLGRAVGDDQLGPRSLAAAALVVTGVVLIQRAAARPRVARGPSGGNRDDEPMMDHVLKLGAPAEGRTAAIPNDDDLVFAVQ